MMFWIMAAHFLLQIFQRFTQHIGHNANAGYHKQKVRHGFHLLSTEVLRNSVQPAATQWSAFHCRQTKLNHIYCCPSILFHTVNEHIRIFVQIPITGAPDSFSHGCAVPDLRRSACLLPAQRAASSTPSKRELQTVNKKLFHLFSHDLRRFCRKIMGLLLFSLSAQSVRVIINYEHIHRKVCFSAKRFWIRRKEANR